MTSNGSVAIPVAHQETQPLLGSQPQQPIQPPLGCRRGPLCRRCLAGSHEDTRKRKYMRRTAFAMICVWLWYLTFGLPHIGFRRRGRGGPLVPWEGRHRFESEKTTVGMIVNIGKGNIAGDVDIQISSDVQRPTILMDAKVTEDEHNFLHAEMEVVNGFFKLRVWADDQNHRRQNQIHAEFNLHILFPATMTSYSSLSVRGTVLNIKAGDLDSIQFNSIDLSSVVGKIEAQSLLVSRLQTFVTEGSITMSNVEAPVNKRLDMELKTEVGHIEALAVVQRLVKGHDSNQIRLRSKTGSLVLDVQQGEHTKDPGSLPGHLTVNAYSEVGHVETNVAVLDEQSLFLDLKSATSTLDARVTDNYLGKIELKSDYGRLELTELTDSKTAIVYKENTRKKKVAQKLFRNGRRSEANGSIQLISDVGMANLKFVEPDY